MREGAMNNMAFETGTTHFLDRFALTRRFEENLESLFQDYNISIITFGQSTILQNNTWMSSRLKKLDTKDNLAALMIKFSPDYIVYKKTTPQTLFFMDAKASITPVFFQSQVGRISTNSREVFLQRSHIGEIEREAWFSYNRFYPDVAIIMASPYTYEVILAEWVRNIKCLWCYKGKENGVPKAWDCKKCPIKSNSGFGVVVNEFAGGSGTPHTNIDFRSMRSLPKFFEEEFNIKIDLKKYEFTMKDFVKQWPLNKTAGTVTWGQYNGAISDLRREGCTWLKYRHKDKLFDRYEDWIKYRNEIKEE